MYIFFVDTTPSPPQLYFFTIFQLFSGVYGWTHTVYDFLICSSIMSTSDQRTFQTFHKAHHCLKVINDFHNFCFTKQQRLQLSESHSLILSACQSVAQNSMTDKGATKPKETQHQQQPAKCVDRVCISVHILTTVCHERGPFPFYRLERKEITRARRKEGD